MILKFLQSTMTIKHDTFWNNSVCSFEAEIAFLQKYRLIIQAMANERYVGLQILIFGDIPKESGAHLTLWSSVHWRELPIRFTNRGQPEVGAASPTASRTTGTKITDVTSSCTSHRYHYDSNLLGYFSITVWGCPRSGDAYSLRDNRVSKVIMGCKDGDFPV